MMEKVKFNSTYVISSGVLKGVKGIVRGFEKVDKVWYISLLVDDFCSVETTMDNLEEENK